MVHFPVITALVIFIITCIFVGLTQVPRVPINRPAGALAGAAQAAVLGLLILGIGAGPALGAERASSSGESFGTVSVIPAGASAPQRSFRIVLLCDDAGERAKGLQGFRPLAKDEAALFLFEPPQPATFWMGSVDFPIDIIFIDRSGAVLRVYPSCAPGSRALYPSGRPVHWVVETAAGSGIREGDRVIITRSGSAGQRE